MGNPRKQAPLIKATNNNDTMMSKKALNRGEANVGTSSNSPALMK